MKPNPEEEREQERKQGVSREGGETSRTPSKCGDGVKTPQSPGKLQSLQSLLLLKNTRKS